MEPSTSSRSPDEEVLLALYQRCSVEARATLLQTAAAFQAASSTNDNFQVTAISKRSGRGAGKKVALKNEPAEASQAQT